MKGEKPRSEENASDMSAAADIFPSGNSRDLVEHEGHRVVRAAPLSTPARREVDGFLARRRQPWARIDFAHAVFSIAAGADHDTPLV